MNMLSMVVLFILLSSILSGCLQSSKKDGGEDFVFTALDGTKKHLSDYRGKIVILDMWATWCGPCQLMMKELKKVYENYSRDNLEIISIDIDSSESAQLIQDYRDWFVQYYGIELDWIFGRDDGSIWEKYHVGDGIPNLHIFDKNGKVYYSNEGYESYSTLASKIDELIG